MIDFNVSSEQELNLRKLANYLLRNGREIYKRGEFDMDTYTARRTATAEGEIDYLYVKPAASVEIRNTTCGTVGCAAGYAPMAGVLPSRDEMTWHTFVREQLAPSRDVFGWCFSADWTPIDNTPYGAALRILKMLNFPIALSIELHRLGQTVLCDGNYHFNIHCVKPDTYIFRDPVNAKLDEWDHE